MSDCFDHMADAWDQYCNSDYMDSQDGFGGSKGFAYNALHYHSKITFKRLIAQTEKSYLFEYTWYGKSVEVWVAKRLLKEFNLKTLTGYVHRKIFTKILNTELT